MKKVSIIIVTAFLTTLFGINILSNYSSNGSLIAKADDTSNNLTFSNNLFSSDSGTGNDPDVPNNFVGTGVKKLYTRNLTTEVFYIDLKNDFKTGGNITISPDKFSYSSYNIPLIITNLYLYNSKTKDNSLIYKEGTSTSKDGFSVTKKSGIEYDITIPNNDNITDYSLVLEISPLNSYELPFTGNPYTPSNVSNYYQHPSYGFNIKGISNDGKVNGSAYSNQNGGMGVIWGNYGSSGSDGLVYLKYYQDSIAVGTNYTSNPHASDGHTFVLNHQLASDIDKFTNTKWVLRDSDGNLETDNFNDADINSLKKGTYYATFYGKDSNSLYSWNTMLLNVVDKGTVTTHYVDENGKKIANDDVITGPAGSNYNTTQKSIDGYNFFKTDGNASGLFNNQNIDVTYIYYDKSTPIPKPQGKVTTFYFDDKNNNIVPPYVQTGNVGDKYTTSPKNFDGYTLIKNSGNTNGVFSDNVLGGSIFVIYWYTKNPTPTPTAEGKVTTHYVDKDGNQIAPNVVQTGKPGDKYSTTQKSINGYTFIKVNGNASGLFTDQNIDVTYVYVKNPTPLPTPTAKGKVTTHYVDENGNQIAPDDIQTGNPGDKYSTTQKSIDGYTFIKVDGNASGLFTDQNIDVTYVYVKNQIPSNNGFSSGNDNSKNSGNNNNSSSSSNNNNNSNIAKKGQAVYAINKIYLYKSNNFNKNNIKVAYSKQKRNKRPMFVVTGYDHLSNGKLIYKVRDVNRNKKTENLTGYITTNKHYVVPVYYSKLPKSQLVKVINPKGIDSSNYIDLSGIIDHYKKGKILKVISIKNYHLTTRYVLENGNYITSNKKYVITIQKSNGNLAKN